MGIQIAPQRTLRRLEGRRSIPLCSGKSVRGGWVVGGGSIVSGDFASKAVSLAECVREGELPAIWNSRLCLGSLTCVGSIQIVL